jgi:hypothetical protein
VLASRSRILGLVLAAWVLAGCAGGSTETAAPALSKAGGAASGAPAQAAPVPAGTPRQVVSTATLGIQVRDLPAAATRAGQLAVEAGGFVAGSDESGQGDGRRGRVTLKVPGDRFDRLVAAVSALGEVRSKQVATEDVTDQVVDLDARLRAQQASADRLQQLIARAATVTEVVGVEGELARRTAEVESLEGRLRVLRDRVELATITVELSPPRPAADDSLPGFLTGLRGGWRGLRATAIVGSAVVGALLPWLVPFGLLVVAGRFAWRRWRRRHPARPRPVLQPAWAAGAPPPASAPLPGPPTEPPAAPPAG